MDNLAVATVNDPASNNAKQPAAELAFVRVSEGLQICDENGWSSIGIDLSSALDKLRALRDSQSE